MKIGVIIGRIGGEDGVALETEKWIEVLQRMGHDVAVITGLLEGDVANVSLLPPLSFDHPDTIKEQGAAFFGAPADEAALVKALDTQAGDITRGLLRWVDAETIDCLLVENGSALPCHLRMGMAVRDVSSATGLPTVTHDHDFAWERGDRYATPFSGIRQIIDRCFPLDLPNVRHAVINSAAQATLASRFGIASVVVPNVMDFDAAFARYDVYNASLRADLGLREDDTLLMQVTRIVRRKGIETAIRLVSQLADPGVRLLVTGTARDDDSGYLDEIETLVRDKGLDDQVLFCGERFDNLRRTLPDGRKVYSLSDAYAHATACTYFSTYEGFGNAFVEAVLARRPIFVNDYEPVYWPDIGSLGFETVMIRKGRLTPQAVDQIQALLADPARRIRLADRNFEIGRRHFSFERLRSLLKELFARSSGLTRKPTVP